jgi:tRNA (guanine37-N1)-methyltransferase
MKKINHHNLIEISLGDYILSGGEIAAITIIDACVRLIPGIVNNKESVVNESFELDLLEFPQYTKPYEWDGMTVPEIHLSGDHKKIAKWQKEQAEDVTKNRRPDLWTAYVNKRKKGPE